MNRRFLHSSALALCLLLAGCSGGKSKALEFYSSGEYSRALTQAQKEASGSSGAKHDRAALTAGLAAAALDERAEAERWLKPLTAHPDPAVSGRAGAALGLLAQQHNEHEQAARLLSAASLKLAGDDGAQAGLQAGDSLTTLGSVEAARLKYELAASKATSEDLRRVIKARLDMGPFTVQIGSYTQRANANRAATDSQAPARKNGYGEPRIILGRNAQGRPLYQVQVGEFKTRQEASTARDRLGAKGVVVSVGLKALGT